MTVSKKSFKITSEQIQVLQNKLETRLSEILEIFKVDINISYKTIYGKCPIHGGDNAQALNLYKQNSDRDIFHWRCYTQHCESHFKKTILGFIRGLLSHSKYNWSRPGDIEETFQETLKWCFDFIGEKPEDLKFDQISEERRRFIQTYTEINKPDYPFFIKKEDALNRLLIPSKYFLNRGFCSDVLIKYGVGDSKKILDRAIVPVFSECGKFCIGYIGRSKLPECKKCRMFHRKELQCPKNYLVNFCKWKEDGFIKNNTFYNYWSAKTHIKKHSCVILVESAGSIWKLEEAGIHVGLGTFGTSLFDEQKILLDKLSPINVIIITDNDEAGKNARVEWRTKLKRYYNVFDIIPKYNDIGQYNRNEIENEIKPIILSKYKKGVD